MEAICTKRPWSMQLLICAAVALVAVFVVAAPALAGDTWTIERLTSGNTYPGNGAVIDQGLAVWNASAGVMVRDPDGSIHAVFPGGADDALFGHPFQAGGGKAVWSDGHQIYRYDSDTHVVSALTSDGMAKFCAAIDPQGGTVAWEYDEAPNGKIQVLDLGGGTTTLAGGKYPWGVQVDGGQVVWYTQSAPYEIWLYDGGDPRVIATSGSGVSSPRISDGHVIYAQGQSFTSTIWDLYLYRPGSSPILLTDVSDGVHNYDIDGDYVVWAGRDWKIWVYTISTGVKRVISGASSTYNYSPTVDGDLVAWNGDVGGSAEIFVYDLARGTRSQVTNNSFDDYEAAISGNQVVWEGVPPDAPNGAIYLATLTAAVAPSPPENLAARDHPDDGGTSLDLTWDPSVSPDVARYLLSRGAAPGDFSTTVDVGNSTSYTDNGLTPSRTYYYALQALDAVGNMSEYSMGASAVTIDNYDTTPPGLTNPPTDMTVEATSYLGALVSFGSATTANDAVDGSAPVTFSPASGSLFPLGETLVTATATDAAGNQTTANFLVTVRDATSPALSLPANMSVEASSPAGAVVTFSVSATDLVTPAPAITVVPASGSTFPLGETLVSVTATDAAGNQATGSFRVTVWQDTTVPPDPNLPPSPPTVVSLYPVSLMYLPTGVAQTFTAAFDDANGAGDLAQVGLLVNTSPTNARAAAVVYDENLGTISLRDDADTAWITGTLGTGMLENGQVVVDLTRSSVWKSGTRLNLSVSLAFKPAYVGTKQVWLSAMDDSRLGFGWTPRGSLGIVPNSAPTITSLVPATIASLPAGQAQIFTATFYDADGAADLAQVYLQVNGAFTSASGAYVYYDENTNEVSLLDDGGVIGTRGTLGTGALENSQVIVDLTQSSVQRMGTSLTFSVSLTFKNGFAGQKTVWLLAQDDGGLSSGWQEKGSLAVVVPNVAPTIVGLVPTSLDSLPVGQAQTFAATFDDADGADDLGEVHLLVNDTLTNTGGAYIRYSENLGTVFLRDDTDTAWITATLGTGTLENGQVVVDLTKSSVRKLGTRFTLTLCLAFEDGFAGQKNVWLSAADDGALSSGWVLMGSLVILPPADTIPPEVSDPPAALTVEATGSTGALVSFGAATTATDLVDGSVPVIFSPASGSLFPLGETIITYSATDAAGNKASGSFIVTVADATAPALTVPADISVESADPTGAVVTFSPLATDIADPSPVVTAVPASGSTFGFGATTVDVTATDHAGNTATKSFTVTVRDTTAPHTTSTIDADWHASDVQVTLTATDGGSGVAETWYRIGTGDDQLGTEFTVAGEGATEVTFWSVDNAGNSETPKNVATVRIDKSAPVLGAITAPVDPTKLGTAVAVSATFTDAGGAGHTALWTWDDGTTSEGVVDESTGSVAGTHTYTTAGVYEVSLTITDWAGRPASITSGYVVMYDPNAGFVTGGGWFDSPAGAYVAQPTLAGKATFGFVSKYKKGAVVPIGETEFQFKAGDLNFHSAVYDWLVVAGAKAQYKGTGTINGQGEYAFMLTATDGQSSGGGGVDKFRIKIWDKTTGTIVYDNQLGAADDALPTTALGGGSIVIHK